MNKTMNRLLRHDAWANAEMARALADLPDPPPRALAWLGHIVGAEVLWLSRLEDTPSPLAVWPQLTPAECLDRVVEAAARWQAILAPGETGLLRVVHYRNSKGEEWSNAAGDIFHHVMLHSGYHRGQIAAELRTHGQAPPYTDYIHAVRQGLLT